MKMRTNNNALKAIEITPNYQTGVKRVLMKSGRRNYKPTDADRDYVDRCVMAGIPIMKIAATMDICDKTLSKYFKFEIFTARARLQSKAIKVLVDALDGGNTEIAKIVLSRVAGWSEKSHTNLTSDDRSMTPKETGTTIDLSKLTPDIAQAILDTQRADKTETSWSS